MSEVDDESIERLRVAAAGAAERDVLDARPPGLADVIARARALDPEALDAHAIATASRIDAERERLAGSTHRDALAAFVAAARRFAEADVRDREVDGVPPRRGRVGTRWLVPAAFLFAVAAVLVIAAGVTRLRSTRVVEDTRGSQAAASVEPGGPAEAVAIERPTAPHAPSTSEPGPPSFSPAPLESAAPTGVDAPATPRRVTSEAQLRALADEAEAALERGEPRRADELLARLIAIGGRHRLVELAYGDRFTIAHRAGIIGEQTKLWRAYLSRFPRGRFADDARAGLCRHAGAESAIDCWQDYLGAFPEGAYRGLARRAIEEIDSP